MFVFFSGRLSERALLFRTTRNSQQTTSNEESFDEEIKRELEGRYSNPPSSNQDICSHAGQGKHSSIQHVIITILVYIDAYNYFIYIASAGHWIPSYARTASSLDIPSEEPAIGRSRAPSSWSVPDSMRHDHDSLAHNTATMNICNHIVSPSINLDSVLFRRISR